MPSWLCRLNARPARLTCERYLWDAGGLTINKIKDQFVKKSVIATSITFQTVVYCSEGGTVPLVVDPTYEVCNVPCSYIMLIDNSVSERSISGMRWGELYGGETSTFMIIG